MKLLDRLLLWVMSLLADALSILLILLVLFPSLGWLRSPAMRIVVGLMSVLCLFSVVAVHLRRAFHRQAAASAPLNDGENGSAYVKLNVIGDMARRIAQEAEGVRSCRCMAKKSAGGVNVELEIALHPGAAVAPLAMRLQEQLKNRIFEMTGIRVEKVCILVEAAQEEKPPRQTIVPQLPGRVK